ncbi:hypothetical protein FVEG_16213 [Fusarium verticillioides 7600]|uniref:Uncharacterized protein n=1 Tax=Gibberella moniliformis (strain M3125 / FGSC 7600) TaxID=334819 RepID=W7MJM2_GIBM7|nr:hypothetical protein FVEG_16213 [Fusarium verticillioides 7600]EWG47929.1 hypothetical protein FVEG_16213 [Fusarium verticillioides 7600]
MQQSCRTSHITREILYEVNHVERKRLGIAQHSAIMLQSYAEAEVTKAQAIRGAINAWDRDQRNRVEEYNTKLIIALARMRVDRFAEAGAALLLLFAICFVLYVFLILTPTGTLAISLQFLLQRINTTLNHH